MKASLALITSFIASAAAHATFQEMWVNGVDQGSYCVRLPPWNSPVTDVTSNDLTCNLVSGTGTSANLCQVQPGDSITVEMHQQPNDRTCATEAIGGAHYGPIIIYLAKVDDATTAVGYSQNWFKIAEIGMPSNNPDYWGTEVLNDNCGHYTFTLPSVAPGQYLLRAEVIALHVAMSVAGAQFYMSCYQINVGGSGSGSPATVKIPGYYSVSDPGILINIYQSLSTYIIPGPSPYATTSPAIATTAWPTTATWNTASQPSTVPTAPVGGASSASSSKASSSTSSSKASSSTSSSKASSSTSSSKTSSSSVKSSSTSSAAGTGQTIYGQCGGTGWTGPTTCAQGTCTYSNAYYSQCL